MHIDNARAGLVSRSTLDARGWTSRKISAALESGTLFRVHHGWYTTGTNWKSSYAEDRHLMQVLAVHAQRRGSAGVFSHTSAAVAHRLPLFRLTPGRVHLSGLGLGGHTTRSAHVARHEVPVGPADLVEIDGIPCTSLTRTVADVIRRASPETGLALADAAFRQVAWSNDERLYDDAAAEVFRLEIADRMLRAPRARGVRRGRRILALADGRAQLPGESVSRLYLIDLGFAKPRLQVPVPAPRDGDFYYVDFGLDDVRAWGEYDGEAKYLDPTLTDGDDAKSVFLAEKRREDWIRGTTDRRFARWGKAAVRSAQALGTHLAAHGLIPPGSR